MASITKNETLRRYGPVAVFGLVVLLGFFARVWHPYPIVFPDEGEVYLLGMDPYFYLRHAETTAANFPDLQKFDHGSHYPNGSTADATGLFTLLIAAPAWIAGMGNPSPELVAATAAWLPPVLSVFVFLFLFGIGRLLYDKWTGVGIAFLFLLYPGYALHRSLLGFADQHVAEILLAAWLVYGLIRCIKYAERTRKYFWMPDLINSLPLVLFYALWPGAPLYVALVGASLLVYITAEIITSKDIRPLSWAVFRYGAGAGIGLTLLWLLVPVILTVLNENMIRLSLLALFGLGAGGLVCLYGATRLIKAGFSGTGVGIGFFAGVLALIMMVYWAVPQVAWSVDFLINRPSETLIENQQVTWRLLWGLGGPVLILFGLALPTVIIKSKQDPSARLALVPLVMGGILLYLWWKAKDFEYLPPLLMAIGAALFVRWAGQEVYRRTTTQARKRKTKKERTLRADMKGNWVLLAMGLLW